MAATLLGCNTGIKPQPGFSAKKMENGGWQATHEFYVVASEFDSLSDSFAKGTYLVALDPDIPSVFHSILRISEVEVTRVEGDYIVVSVTATGGSSQFESDQEELTDEAAPTYTLTGSLSEKPLTEHPKFKLLTPFEQDILQRVFNKEPDFTYNPEFAAPTSIEGPIGYYKEVFPDEGDTSPGAIQYSELIWISRTSGDLPPTPIRLSETATEFADRIAKGIQTYLVPQLTWTESTQGADKLTPQQLNKLGKISEPRGNPPTPTDGRNWMLTSATQQQRGELFDTDLEWSLSDSEGHDPFLYGTEE